MTIKMVARRRYYAPAEGKEYEKGQEFSVGTQKEADKLLRSRRAMLSTSMRAETAAPRTRARPRTKPDAQPDGAAQTQQSTAGSYFRSDMRAED